MSNQPDEVTRRWLKFALAACVFFFFLDVFLKIRPTGVLNFNTQDFDPSVFRVLVALAIWALSGWYTCIKWHDSWRVSRTVCFVVMLMFVGAFSVRHVPHVLRIAQAQVTAELNTPMMQGDPDIQTGGLQDEPTSAPALMPPQTPIVELEKMPTQKRRTTPKPPKDESAIASFLRWLNENSKPSEPDDYPYRGP